MLCARFSEKVVHFSLEVIFAKMYSPGQAIFKNILPVLFSVRLKTQRSFQINAVYVCSGDLIRG